jgi:pyoverdine/dityrosine biosynthesis protein Dit1
MALAERREGLEAGHPAVETALLGELLSWTEDEAWRRLAPDDVSDATRFAIRRSLESDAPIRFVLPAFPAKSANPRKTSGQGLDLGDVTALFRLERLCERSRQLHRAGAEVVLCSDGRVFADLVGVPDAAVSRYRDDLRRALDRHRLGSIRLFCLEDAYGDGEPDALRDRLVDEFAVTVDALRSDVERSPARRSLVNGIHRFLLEDAVGRDPGLSRNAARHRTRPLAYETVRRSDAWSRLVAARFAGAVRLSIHPQLPGSDKVPVRLLPADERWATPWHRSARWDGRRLSLARREALEAEGAVPALSADGWTYWRAGDAGSPPAPAQLAEEAFR